MSGDKVDLSVRYFYNNAGSTDQAPFSPSDLLGGLASGLFTVAGGGMHGSVADLTNPSTSPLVGALNSWVNDPSVPDASGRPKAYLNWMLLDNQFRYVGGNSQSGALQVGGGGTDNGNLRPPLAQGITLQKSGYLYIYLSNVTEHQDVFFDNLSVVHYSGPMLEETHYYPFGLTMAGISDKTLKGNYTENKYRYNDGGELQNKEFSDGSGLEAYDAGYRMYDPQLGRFWQPDPLADITEDWSPYAFGQDNPVLLNDPIGLLSDSSHPEGLAPAYVSAAKRKKKQIFDIAAAAGPAPTRIKPPIQSDEERKRYAAEVSLLGSDLYNLQYQINNTVVREPSFWDRFLDNGHGGRLIGYNWKGKEIRQPFYGGEAPSEGPGAGAGRIFREAEEGINIFQRTKSVLNHVFRNSPGHLNISSIAAQERYIKLFEKVANNASNLNQSILNSNAIANGVKGYTKIFRNGSQIWVMVRNGKIVNAGLNLIPK